MQDKEAAPLDAEKSAGQWSQVSKKNTAKRTGWLWLVGGALMVGVVLLLSAKSDEPTAEVATTSPQRAQFRSALNANLKQLNTPETVQTHAVVGEAFTLEPPMTPVPQGTRATPSKDYVARQHAPTSMYSSPASERQTSVTASDNPSGFAGHSANARFANTATVATAVKASHLAHPAYTIANGEFLHAVLETAIDSDLPGMVRAVVSRPAYAYTGEQPIIPAGARLIGQYSSEIAQGQRRVMVIWNRMLLPNGITVQLNSPGVDALGRAGQGADSVNRHFFERFGESALLSLIGAGTATAGVNDNDQYNSASQYRMAISQSFRQSAQDSLQGSVAMKPSLHIYQGARINVFVAHDLSFYDVLKDEVRVASSLPGFVK